MRELIKDLKVDFRVVQLPPKQPEASLYGDEDTATASASNDTRTVLRAQGRPAGIERLDEVLAQLRRVSQPSLSRSGLIQSQKIRTERIELGHATELETQQVLSVVSNMTDVYLASDNAGGVSMAFPHGQRKELLTVAGPGNGGRGQSHRKGSKTIAISLADCAYLNWLQ